MKTKDGFIPKDDLISFLSGVNVEGDTAKSPVNKDEGMAFMRKILEEAVQEAEHFNVGVYNMEDERDLHEYCKILNRKSYSVVKETDFQSTVEEFSPDGTGTKRTVYKRVVDYKYIDRKEFIEHLSRYLKNKLGTRSFFVQAIKKYFPDTENSGEALLDELSGTSPDDDAKPALPPKEDTTTDKDVLDDMPDLDSEEDE